jgi:hypothetical protein
LALLPNVSCGDVASLRSSVFEADAVDELAGRDACVPTAVPCATALPTPLFERLLSPDPGSEPAPFPAKTPASAPLPAPEGEGEDAADCGLEAMSIPLPERAEPCPRPVAAASLPSPVGAEGFIAVELGGAAPLLVELEVLPAIELESDAPSSSSSIMARRPRDDAAVFDLLEFVDDFAPVALLATLFEPLPLFLALAGRFDVRFDVALLVATLFDPAFVDEPGLRLDGTFAVSRGPDVLWPFVVCAIAPLVFEPAFGCGAVGV